MPKLLLVDGSNYLFRAFHALPPLTTSKGEPTGAIKGFNGMLRTVHDTVSPDCEICVFDAKGRDAERENSYHMLLVGLLAGKADWLVRSNVEAGEGFADIIVETDDLDDGVIVELKYAQTMTAMEKSCAKALAQIRAKRYADYLYNNGREKVLLYGIAFCKKRCRVVAEKL